VVGLALTAAACSSTDAGVETLSEPAGGASGPVGEPDPAGGGAPAGRSQLRWQECGPRFDCGTIEVPVDWTDPAGPTVELFVKRYVTADRENRIGSLLVNPGGPGVPGTSLVDQADLAFTPDLLDRFDIVSWDTRGSGRSDQIDCATNLDDLFGLDPTPDTRLEQQELDAAETALTEGCQAGAGDLLPFMATEDTARDMDAIREALGEETISFFGFSYGSTLGAVYATLYPERVRAMVLDGATDPNADTVTSARQTTLGLERSLDEALSQCSGDPGCPFHNGGDAEGAFDELLVALDQAPLIVSPDRPAVGQGVAYYAILSALYAEFYWPRLMQALADAQAGDAAQLLAMYDDYLRRLPDGDFEGIFESLFAVNCIDDPGARDPEVAAILTEELPAIAPRLGPWAASGDVCGKWPAPARQPVTVSAEGAGPIVVIGTTGDPVTPLDATAGMARALDGGVLVTVESEQHTGYGTNDCVNDAVSTYLLDLEPPPAGLVCR
jgi:pimeloyl-ACP methyl ester carboxylesterase